MEADGMKWIAIFSLFAMAVLGGLSPLWVRHLDPQGRYLSMGNMLSAGIFLGGGLLHLLPESAEALHDVAQSSESALIQNFPHAFFLCGCGFMVILLVEEVVMSSTTAAPTSPEDSAASPSLAVATPTDTSSGASTPKGRRSESPVGRPIKSMTPRAGEYNAGRGGEASGQQQQFLRTYFARRGQGRDVARSIIASLNPRAVLMPVHDPVVDSPLPRAVINRRKRSSGRRQRSSHAEASTTAAAAAGAAEGGRGAGDAKDAAAFEDAGSPPSKMKLSMTLLHHEAPSSANPDQPQQQQHPARKAATERDRLLPGGPVTDSGSAETKAGGNADAGSGSGSGLGARRPPLRVATARDSDHGETVHTEEEGHPSDEEDQQGHSHAHAHGAGEAEAEEEEGQGAHGHSHTPEERAHSHSHSHGGGEEARGKAAAAGGDHGHSHGHGGGGDGHAHFNLDPNSSGALVAYVLVLALSFHSVFEGIALGTQQTLAETVSIFIVIAAHTPLAGFALGISLVHSKAKLKMIVSCVLLFAVTVPIGALLGIFLSWYLEGDLLKGVSAGFQAFSSGTFLFVAFEEIIPKELANPCDKARKLALLFLGFAAMSGVKMLDQETDHAHGGR